MTMKSENHLNCSDHNVVILPSVNASIGSVCVGQNIYTSLNGGTYIRYFIILLCFGIYDNWQIKRKRRSLFVARNVEIATMNLGNFFSY